MKVGGVAYNVYQRALCGVIVHRRYRNCNLYLHVLFQAGNLAVACSSLCA